MLPKSLRRGRRLSEAVTQKKKRWQEYIEQLYKKDLHDQDNHDSVITHVEPDNWNARSSGLYIVSL